MPCAPVAILRYALTHFHTAAPGLHTCAQAWQIYRSLDVEYVFVVFGGLVRSVACACVWGGLQGCLEKRYRMH